MTMETRTTYWCFEGNGGMIYITIFMIIPFTLPTSSNYWPPCNRIIRFHIWLVVFSHPSEKYEFVNWDDEIPNIWENKIDVSNHQPVSYHQLGLLFPIYGKIKLMFQTISFDSISFQAECLLTFDPPAAPRPPRPASQGASSRRSASLIISSAALLPL